MGGVARWVWSGVLLVSAAVFAWGIPTVATLGPDVLHLDEPLTIPLAGSTVTLPTGWEVEIEDTVRGRPNASGDGLRVRVMDGLWFGESSALVERVAELTGSDGATLPEIPADAMGQEREDWRFESPAVDDAPALRVDVVRWEQLVVVIMSNTPEDAAHPEVVDQIVASINFEGIPLDAGGPTRLSLITDELS